MRDYTESLNQSIKATLDKELKRLAAPKLEVAAREIPTRG
jgi:hypothetical protein